MASTIKPAEVIADEAGLYIRVRTNLERAVTDVETLQVKSQTVLSGTVATLVGTGVTRFVAPVAGTITAAYIASNGTLTTGNATVTLAIGGVAVTGGAITVPYLTTVAGTVASCTPTAARTVAAGNLITATVGGTNATATSAELFIVISRF